MLEPEASFAYWDCDALRGRNRRNCMPSDGSSKSYSHMPSDGPSRIYPLVLASDEEERPRFLCKPRLCEVIFEELGGDLCDGVKTSPTKEVYEVVQRNPKIDIVDFKDNQVTVESLSEAEDVGPRGIWEVLSYDRMFVGSPTARFIPTEGRKTKIVHSYPVAFISSNAYLQLVCLAKKTMHNGNCLHCGDILTLYRHKEVAPIVTVTPSTPRTFVALPLNGKLQVVTNGREKIRWDFGKRSSLNHIGVCNFKTKVIQEGVYAEVFECINAPTEQEYIHVVVAGEYRTICIPPLGRKNLPIITPTPNCVIHTNGMDGFIIKTITASVMVEQGCPLKLDYTVDLHSSTETKVKLTQSHSCFIMRYSDGKWLIGKASLRPLARYLE